MNMSKTKTNTTRSPVKSRAKVVAKDKTSKAKAQTKAKAKAIEDGEMVANGDRYIVKAPFKCKATGAMYKAGKDVSNFDKGRLNELVKRGLVERFKGEDPHANGGK